jgi:hypothetical protein
MTGPSWPPTSAQPGIRDGATTNPATAAAPANPLIPEERDPGPRLGLIGRLRHPTKTKTSARRRQRAPSATSREATSRPGSVARTPPALLSGAIS